MKKYIKPEIKSFDAELMNMLMATSGGLSTGDGVGNAYDGNSTTLYGKEEEFWGDEEW